MDCRRERRCRRHVGDAAFPSELTGDIVEGLSVKAYLAKLAGEKEQERALQTATAAFRRAISEPGVMDAFDAEFGGLPSVAHNNRRAA